MNANTSHIRKKEAGKTITFEEITFYCVFIAFYERKQIIICFILLIKITAIS